MLTFLTAACLSVLQWELRNGSLTGGGPAEFSDHAAGWDAAGQRFVVFYEGNTYAGSGNPVVWTTVNTTAAAPANRHSMVFGSDGAGLVIATGEGPGKVFYNDVWRFTYSTNTWARLSADNGSRPDARYGASGGVYQVGTRYVVQLTHGFSSVRYGDTWEFDLTARAWTRINAASNEYTMSTPHPRCLAPGTTNRGNLFMFGGCLSGGETGGPCPSHDGWCYSRALGWRQITTGRPTPRVRGGMAPHPTSSSKALMVTSGSVSIGQQWLEGEAAPGAQVSVMDCDRMRWDFFTPAGSQPPRLSLSAIISFNNSVAVVGGRGGALNVWVLSWDAAVEAGTPGSGGVGGYITLPILHAVFMFLGWGVCCNLGVLLARFWKASDPTWFKAHRALMSTGLLFSIIGFGLIIPAVQSKHFMFAHGGIGLAVMIMGLLQPLNAFFRPHKEPPSALRTAWEYLHKMSGRVALLLANINIILGLLLIVSPIAAFAVGVVYIGLVFLAFLALELVMRLKYGFTSDWQAEILRSVVKPSSTAPDSIPVAVSDKPAAGENESA